MAEEYCGALSGRLCARERLPGDWVGDTCPGALTMAMLSPACVPQARRASAPQTERETSASHPHPLIRCRAAALAACTQRAV